MNKHLHDLYHRLDEIERSKIKHKFKNSPVLLSLVDYIEVCKNPNFKSAAAVEFIYKKEKNAQTYSVLENRYFKLRKKLQNELQEVSIEKTQNVLAAEEQMLNHCKFLIAEGDKKQAHKELTELKNKCWEKNIFELLPSIIDNLIFCNQTFNNIDKNKTLYVEMRLAIDLQHDMNRVNMLARKLYDVFFTQKNKIKEVLKSINEFALKNKTYPRFAMCYHHLSLYYKLSSQTYLENMQILSRHLSAFKKLYSGNPLIPLMAYKANYEKHIHFHFYQITALFQMSKVEFEEANTAMKKMMDLVKSKDSTFKIYNTETLYYNYFLTQCFTSRYKEALETCDLYTTFLKENKQTEKRLFPNVLKSFVFVSSYPQTFNLDADYLLKQLSEYIKKAEDNTRMSLAQTMLIKAEFFLLKGKYKEAEKIVNDEKVKNALQDLNAYFFYKDVISGLKNNFSKEKWKIINKEIQQQLYKATKLDEFMVFGWLTNFTNYCLKKKD
ncbi:MAG TPA: hypothetical protein VNG53_10595 [Bacteroidia bacterium]|nr:hypothetical protein [Bacteroidia bacterium]